MHANEGFDGMIACGHALEQLRQLAQGAFAGHKITGMNQARFDVFQSTPDSLRSVMETRQQGQIRVMQQRCVQGNAGPGRATAKN